MADLPNTAVRDLIDRLDTLLEQLEQATGPVADIASQAVAALATVYGTALGRVLALADGPVAAALARDELLRHLFVLHGLRPEPRASAPALIPAEALLRRPGGVP
jgi:hypothetical protein